MAAALGWHPPGPWELARGVGVTQVSLGQKNTGRPLPRFPARRGCQAAARGSCRWATDRGSSCFSPGGLPTLDAAERSRPPSCCTGSFSPWWDALETEMPFCSGRSAHKRGRCFNFPVFLFPKHWDSQMPLAPAQSSH